MKLNPTNGNILVELQKLKKMFSFESDQKDVSFHLSINLKRYNINADIKKINQILIILVSNAFKYTYKGAISVHCEEQNKMLKFEVSDTGIGIKEENLPQLFHEFSSPDRVNKEKSTSSGFQLALIKKLVTLMGGDIYVQSTFGEGTIFSLLLKVEWIAINKSITENLLEREITENIDAGKVAPRQSSELKFIQMLTNHKTTAEIIIIPDTVLIVDDNCANIFVLQRMLNMLKIKSEKAMNGLECVKKVSERGINGYIMILMDINMPIMNGFEATKALNKLKLEGKISNTPIIAVTAQSETSMIEQCKQLGINKCVFKPVKMVELKELIAEYKVKEYTNSNFDSDK
jgi:CheY-like chemotaxis protein